MMCRSCGVKLTECYPPIVGGNTLMPVRLKVFLPESGHSSFREVPILKTSARKNNTGVSGKASDVDNGFHKPVVEFQRNFSGRDSFTKIVKEPGNKG